MTDTKDFIDSEDDEVMTGFEIKFMDEEGDLDDEEKGEDTEEIEATPEITFEGNMKLVDIRPYTQYIFPSVTTYDFQPWDKFYPDMKVDLTQLVFNTKWYEFFDLVYQKKYFGKIEQILSKVIEKKHTILPYPELVFNALNILSPAKIKVVIIGQDPYFNTNLIGIKSIPQAMGCSFSVPRGYPKPPSLTNIYKNLFDHHHITSIPTTGNLSYWLLQGCLMINAAFTTIQGKANAHKDTWKEFTQDLIKYINSACDNVVFMAWGKDAHTLCLNIDPTKHHIITSSHPSPYSYSSEYNGWAYGLDVKNRKQVKYPPFKDTDHFGEANSYLQSIGKSGIIWDLFE
jgi:uracil-DNA glycosylase